MAIVANPEIQKADLWKDGDVITAEKLNRIVFANAMAIDENGNSQLNITPDDVFDENNVPTSLVVVVVEGSTYCNFYISRTLGFMSTYSIIVPTANENMMFTASSRTDYFTTADESGGLTPE